MLPQTNAAGYSPQQIMMTLAAIAYGDSSDNTPTEQITAGLANPAYATQNEWKLVWGPAYTLDGYNVDNLMYVAQYADYNLYAVVIRGTVLTYDLSTLVDLFEDLEVSCTQQWTYPYVDNACVAEGTLAGLDILTTLQDSSTGQTLLEYLSSLPSAYIYVTGHSLGGCLTTVLAPWLTYQFEQNSVSQQYILPYTFAAPTAGNQPFADWYNQQFTFASARCYNDIDVIPMAWNNLYGIEYLFPGGPSCPWAMDGLLDLVIGWLAASNVSYAQTNGAGTSLAGTSTQNSDWFTEMEIQHWHNTYLSLLGAPLVGSTTPPTRRQKRHHPALMQPAKPASDGLGSAIKLE